MSSLDPDTAEQWMRLALTEASAAAAAGEIPVGAVVVDEHGNVIGVGRNDRERTADPTAHAEIVALRQAAAHTGNWNLAECTLVVTLEPCAMCAGTILAAHVGRLVYGAWDDKAGAVGSVYDLIRDRRLPQRCEVLTGILADESVALLQQFFRERR